MLLWLLCCVKLQKLANYARNYLKYLDPDIRQMLLPSYSLRLRLNDRICLCFYGVNPSYSFHWKRTHTHTHTHTNVCACACVCVCVCEALVSYVQIQCMFQFASYNLTFYSIAVMVIGGGWLDCSDLPIALFQSGSHILFVLISIYKIFENRRPRCE